MKNESMINTGRDTYLLHLRLPRQCPKSINYCHIIYEAGGDVVHKRANRVENLGKVGSSDGWVKFFRAEGS
jgi:hypothetical protein